MFQLTRSFISFLRAARLSFSFYLFAAFSLGSFLSRSSDLFCLLHERFFKTVSGFHFYLQWIKKMKAVHFLLDIGWLIK